MLKQQGKRVFHDAGKVLCYSIIRLDIQYPGFVLKSYYMGQFFGRDPKKPRTPVTEGMGR